jgi:phospholipase/carboxylesterase
MKTQTLEKITIATPDHVKPKASVIWLHGLGADGHDFAPIVPELNLPEELGIRFIFPHAPIRPVTLNAGMEMPAWFDIHGLGLEHKHDEEGLAVAHQQLIELIEAERKLGIPADKIILAGFSQGGALALYTGMTYHEKLGGIMALSTYLPVTELDQLSISPEQTHTPIFMAHGLADPVVELELGEISKGQIAKLGFSVDWRTYHMAHSVCMQEIEDISAWLAEVLK